MNSKRKGKEGELRLVHFLREHGYECRRTAQYCGKTGEAADVIGLPGLHIECKAVERLNVREALKQAVRDARCISHAQPGGVACHPSGGGFHDHLPGVGGRTT